MTLIILLQAIATYFMCGVIWFVQIVHYPLFQAVPNDARPRYCQKHCSLVSWVVIPAMLIELGTAVMTFLYDRKNPLWITGLILLALIWITTFAWIAPLHNRLVKNGDTEAAKKIVVRNWIRTALWSLRALILYLILRDFYTH